LKIIFKINFANPYDRRKCRRPLGLGRSEVRMLSGSALPFLAFLPAPQTRSEGIA